MSDIIEDSWVEPLDSLVEDQALNGAVSLLQNRLRVGDSNLFSYRKGIESTNVPAGDILQSIRLVNRRLMEFMVDRKDVYETQVSFFYAGSQYEVGDTGEWHIDGVQRAFVALGGIADLHGALGKIPDGDQCAGTLLYKPRPEQIKILNQGQVGLINGETIHRRGPIKKLGGLSLPKQVTVSSSSPKLQACMP